MLYNQKINIQTINKIIILTTFIISFFNSLGLTLFMIFLMLFGILKDENAIKSICLITLRGILNPGIAVPTSQVELIKWAVLFICAAKLWKSYFNILNREELNKILFPITLYLLYSSISSFIFSTLPIVALMKIISYGFIFMGMLVGIYTTIIDYDWIRYIYKQLLFIVLISIPLIPTSIGYLLNGRGFQGATNQPNMFGIILVLFIAINIVMLQTKKHKRNIRGHLLNVVSLALIWLTQSRTSFISASILLFIYLLLSNINLLKKGLLVIIISIIFISILFFASDLLYEIQEFLLKGADSLLYSRAGQVNSLLASFESNPLFGTGFAVPVLSQRLYIISTEFVVEPGNLILSVLAYGGIFGLILFFFYIINIILSNKRNFKNLIYLPLSAILISMGEMVFFSSNSIGPWLYLFIAIYAFENNNKLNVPIASMEGNTNENNSHSIMRTGN